MLETVSLSDPRCPLRIEYSCAALEQIRRRARAGLMAAPRVGMAVGGLLLGVRESSGDGSRIRILDSIDLPCSHSTGPSFTLTAEEKLESREMVAEANALSAASKVGVVGWYCSKTRGDAVLSESDQSFFADLLPGADKIALVLRPDVFEAMRAVFHFRDARGVVVKGLECEVDEWRPAPPAPDPAAETPAPAPMDPPPPPKVIEIRQPAPRPQEVKPQEVKPQEAAPAPAPQTAAAAEASGDTSLEAILGLSESAAPAPAAQAFRSPLFAEPEFLRPRPQRSSKLLLIIAAAGLVLALALVGFFTRNSWLPRTPLSLTISEDNGSLLIHWDTDSVRGIAHASMYVNDGGQPQPMVIPLDRLELDQGQVSYKPKSKHVTAKLEADGNISAISSWFAPEPAKKADADPNAAAAPADTTPKK